MEHCSGDAESLRRGSFVLHRSAYGRRYQSEWVTYDQHRWSLGKGSLIVFDGRYGPCNRLAMIGIFFCAGQVCSATSRVLVHENIAEEFLSRLKSKAEYSNRTSAGQIDTDGPVVGGSFNKINESIRNALQGGFGFARLWRYRKTNGQRILHSTHVPR